MKRTAELRWFVEADLTDALCKWFAELGPGRQEPPRTDIYLVTPDPGVNIKKREGRLEIKRRDAYGGMLNGLAGPSGYLERWRKWIEPVSHMDRYLHETGSETPRWISVGKSRQLQSFSVKEEVQPVPVYSNREQGCNIELTRLTVNEQVWWTFCFEAFGPEELLPQILTRAAGQVFASHAPEELTAEQSYGYAQWLLHL